MTSTRLDRLLAAAPSLSDLLRGSLLHRKTFHAKGCATCARGLGHPQWVLNVNYPGGRNRQISLRRDQLPLVRRRLKNFRQLKKLLESICELNLAELRSGGTQPSSRRSKP